jgi:hypothetical protein
MLGWLAYKQVTKTTKDQSEFYRKLSKELIDNTYNRRGRKKINGYTSKFGRIE